MEKFNTHHGTENTKKESQPGLQRPRELRRSWRDQTDRMGEALHGSLPDDQTLDKAGIYARVAGREEV